ncbi:uncharacterized protein At2g29880-like [Rosa rugosa]|uniref:uncharacterized protein At2g29880-like n=1 Tax=Rosa rugosa TaxID=74645 RepID=UPI002B4082C8|nr:uncharacterized protein At2g29880-like [Rosa rugosa]
MEKKNGNYEQWTKEESDTLLELMVDAAVRGWRDNIGILSKQTVEKRTLHILNAKLGCHKTYKNYQSKVRWFKGRWNSYSTLMRFSSGFVFDSTTKRFTASNEVWEEYLKAHPKNTDLRYGTFDDYEDLEIAIGNGVAVGKNSVGLGSVTNARTLGVGEVMINLQEKRERQSKIWDAIMEIPNLDEATGFKTLELLDTKTKKDRFLNMSPQQRSKWIFHKLGGL